MNRRRLRFAILAVLIGASLSVVAISRAANPTLTTAITSGPNGPTNQQPSFSFKAPSDPSATFRCSQDGAAFTTCTSSHGYTVAVGSHTFAVHAINGGAPGPDTPRSFTFDNTAPTTTIDSGPSGPTNQQPSFTFSSS